MRDEIALQIGKHIIDQYQRWTEKPMGNAVVMPVRLPSLNNQPDWCMNITCDMPWFIEYYFEKGERKSKHWTMKEWYKRTRKKTSP